MSGAPTTVAMHRDEQQYTEFTPVESSLITCVQCVYAPCFFCFYQQVDDFERTVTLRMGKRLYSEAGKGGLYVVWPCIDELVRVDVRERTVNIPHQAIVTKEGLTVVVDGVVYYKVVDAIKVVFGVEDYHSAVTLLSQTKLREVLGSVTFEDLQADREGIAVRLREALDTPTDPWGIDITRVELTDVKLPSNIQRAMGQEAEAQRNAKAKVIEAEGEKKAAQTLLNAANTMKDNPAAMQLRFLQTLTSVAAENNKTIILPYPSEMTNGNNNSNAMSGMMAGLPALAS